MFAALRLLLLVSLAPACSVVNADHCANLDGDATCRQRDPDRPYCSQCVGDNNGCFADIPDDSCHAVTVAQPASSSSSSSSSAPTSTGSTTTTVDPTTSTSDDTTSSSSSSSTTDPSTSSSSDTTDATTSTTGDTTTTTDPSSTGTSDDTGSTTSSSTGDGPVCGDNTIEGDEVCDGAKLDGQTCTKILPSKWGGGTLKCTNTCKSFDDTDCCIGVGQACNYLLQPDELCCPGLNCPLSGKCTVKP